MTFFSCLFCYIFLEILLPIFLRVVLESIWLLPEKLPWLLLITCLVASFFKLAESLPVSLQRQAIGFTRTQILLLVSFSLLTVPEERLFEQLFSLRESKGLGKRIKSPVLNCNRLCGTIRAINPQKSTTWTDRRSSSWTRYRT